MNNKEILLGLTYWQTALSLIKENQVMGVVMVTGKLPV
jgi:hypothetical protein